MRPLPIIAAAIAIGLICAISTGDTEWQHDPATPGDWFDPANWTAGVPVSGEHGIIDNGGTAEISSGNATSGQLTLGAGAGGTVDQTGGYVSVQTLNIGCSASSTGTYELSGDGYLSSSNFRVGATGVGVFRQSGGEVHGHLHVGWGVYGEGVYELEAGIVRVQSMTIGAGGTGTLTQTGGLSELVNAGCMVGRYDGSKGTYDLRGGEHLLAQSLVLGNEAGASGTYRLSGSGHLQAESAIVGAHGTGQFTQDGGVSTLEEYLYVGYLAEGTGTCELNGGQLSADTVYVGYEGTGRFLHTGGTLACRYARVNVDSTFQYTGGVLALRRRMDMEGTLDFDGSAVTLSLPEGVILDVGAGRITNSGSASIQAAANTLIVFPNDFDPSTQLAGYVSAGVTHRAGTDLVVPAGRGFVGDGEFGDFVECHGTISVPETPGSSFTLTGGLQVMPGGDIDLGMGVVRIDDTRSAMTGGGLQAYQAIIGKAGSGRFTQTGGNIWQDWRMYVGEDADSDGVCTISGGEMSAIDAYLAYDGTGRIIQTGGTVNFRGHGIYSSKPALVLGQQAGSLGEYHLGSSGRLILGGRLRVGGYKGDGRYVQSGGTLVAGRGISMGTGEGQATFELTAGRIDASSMGVGDTDGVGTGTVQHTGGELVLTGGLNVVHGGRYELSGDGTVQGASLTVGEDGGGELVQMAGDVEVGEMLIGATGINPDGTYELIDGSLNVGTVSIGWEHDHGVPTGVLRQTGGASRIGYMSIAKTGRYEFSGGTVEIADGLTLEGEVDFLDSAVTMSLTDGAMLDVKSPGFFNAHNASLSVGANSLCVFPAGFDPASVFGSFHTDGAICTPGATLVIPAGANIVLSGDLTDHVLCEGSLGVREGEQLSLLAGLELRGGSVILGTRGGITVEDAVSCNIGGNLRTRLLSVGRDGVGSFTQVDGTTDADLSLGVEAGAEGTYSLSGQGSLAAYTEYIGVNGIGRFVHSSGANTVGYAITLGQEGGTGSYELSGGAVTAERVYVGSTHGSGHWQQTGGSLECEFLYVHSYDQPSRFELAGGHVLSTGCEFVTGTGTAVFAHTAGTNALTTTNGEQGLVIAQQFGEVGEYHLSGSGVLDASHIFVAMEGVGQLVQDGGQCITDNLKIARERSGDGTYELLDGSLSGMYEHIGYLGRGTFIQTGGTNIVSGSLRLGEFSESEGTYLLSSGKLASTEEHVGVAGPGLFRQSGGDNMVAMLTIGATGRYELVGGQLSFHGLRNDGVLAFSGSPQTIMWDNCMLDLSLLGNLENADAVSLTMGPNSLVIESAGVDPAAIFGSFSHLGLSHVPGTLLSVPADRGFSGAGTIDGDLECAGTVTANENTFLNVTGDVKVLPGGVVELGQASLTATGTKSGIDQGRLAAGALCVAHAGTAEFTQAGGENEIATSLTVAHGAGSQGVYRQTGGVLSVGTDLQVGVDSTADGTFVSDAGTVTVADMVSLGIGRNTTGRYELLGDARLEAMWCLVGVEGAGDFVQDGGVHTVYGTLYLGNRRYGTGTYELKGGSLTADGQFVGGGSQTAGDGVFVQTGGSNTTRWLTMARDSSGHGSYSLSAGTLTATETVTVASLGTGTLAQTGGTLTAGGIDIGRDSVARGTYDLSGGVLNVARMTVGRDAWGTWNIQDAAATVNVTEWLRFGPRGAFSAAPGSTVHMQGAALENRSTDPAALAGLTQTTLLFEGGVDVPSTVEVAGADLGLDLGGWTDNFAIGTVQLGGAAPGRIELVDAWDNQADGPGGEALYVTQLILNPGAKISFLAGRLYYLNGGDPKQFLMADANLDGQVGIADLTTLADHYGDVGGVTWRQGDFNGDGMVGIADLVALGDHYGGGEPAGGSGVPEPATVLLLAMGSAILARRRVR